MKNLGFSRFAKLAASSLLPHFFTDHSVYKVKMPWQ